MLSKLSLFDRIKFYRKKGCWLSKGEEVSDLKFVGIDVYLDQNSSAWMAERIEGKLKITKIGKKAFHFHMPEQKTSEIFFVGTEGLFHKPSETKKIHKIYGGKITGARVMLVSSNVVILYQDKNDTILQILPNSNGQIEKEIRGKVVFVGRPIDELQREIFGTSCEKHLTIKEIDGYYTYTIGVQNKGLFKE